MARKFKDFVERPKPRKRPGVHKKRRNKPKKDNKKIVDIYPLISYNRLERIFMIYNIKQKIINNLYESELFEPSIGRTAHKAATLIEKLVESKEPKKELKEMARTRDSL
jgi:hypothetical protein